jgi:predicted membrane-bound spermidine synthase
MITSALLLVAFVVGWITTLSLVRDLRRLELTDFLIAASGAFCSAFLLMPRLGLPVWGDYGLRLSTLFGMALAAMTVLVLANLLRGRGFRAGKLCLSNAVLSPSQSPQQLA